MKQPDTNDELQRRLRSLGDHLTPRSPSGGITTAADKSPSRYHRLAVAVGGELRTLPNGAICVVGRTCRWGERIGNAILSAPTAQPEIRLASFQGEETAETLLPAELLFFDCETTSLGGAGSVAFLVGCGFVTSAGFTVRQYLLPDYSDEAALLEAVLAEFQPHRTLVSFNGVTFDAPILRDRLIVNRVARELPCRRHIDLLPASRRLFRRRLPDCRLTTLEQELFSFFREDDIPGYLVPSVYFDWLHTENTAQLAAVVRHNYWDILSMYLLLMHINRVFVEEGAPLSHTEDVYSLSRVYGRRGRHEKVVALLDEVRQAQQVTPEVTWFHSLALKRSGDWTEAVAAWKELLGTGTRESVWAAIELAKYCEHRTRSYHEALQYARLALRNRSVPSSLRQAVAHRVSRLERKLTACLSSK